MNYFYVTGLISLLCFMVYLCFKINVIYKQYINDFKSPYTEQDFKDIAENSETLDRMLNGTANQTQQ